MFKKIFIIFLLFFQHAYSNDLLERETYNDLQNELMVRAFGLTSLGVGIAIYSLYKIQETSIADIDIDEEHKERGIFNKKYWNAWIKRIPTVVSYMVSYYYAYQLIQDGYTMAWSSINKKREKLEAIAKRRRGKEVF